MPWVLLLALGACTSPYQFSKEVGGFSTGVDQVTAAFADGYASLAADQIALMQQEQLRDKRKLHLPFSCGEPVIPGINNQEPCLLLAGDQKAPIASPMLRTRPVTMRRLKDLSDYAHGLAAVTNAADRAEYDAAAKRLDGAVVNLTKYAEGMAPGASSIASAVINATTWVIGQALDRDRFDKLQYAVTNAEIPIREIGKALRSGLQAIAQQRITLLKRSAGVLVDDVNTDFSRTSYRERFERAETARLKLETVRQSRAEDAINRLVTAHDALAAAVKDPDTDLNSLISAVSDFVNHAKAVHAALAMPAK